MFFELTISSQTINPMPPTVMSIATVTRTTGFLFKVVSPEPGAIFPKRSNPALQNADTEWNIPNQIASLIPRVGMKLTHNIMAPTNSKNAEPINSLFWILAMSLITASEPSDSDIRDNDSIVVCCLVK